MEKFVAIFLAIFVALSHALIKGPPEVETEYLDRYVAQVGDTVKLNCPIIGTPKPIIEWYQDDRLIHTTWERFRPKQRYLKIKQVTLADSGVLVCKGVNGFGSVSVQMHLLVKDRREVERGRFNNEAIRRFQDSPTDFAISQQQGISNGNPLANSAFATADVVDVEAAAPILVKTTTFYGDGIHKQVSETLKLECLVDGAPPPNIIWYKDGDILLTPNLHSDRAQTILMIPNLQSEDSGNYGCKARNVWGEINATFPVKVYDRLQLPIILDAQQENRSAALGSQLTLQCAIRSIGPTQIQWLKQLHDDQSPRDRNKTVVVFDYVFEILKATSELNGPGGFHNSSLTVGPALKHGDAGRYICLVNNPEGHAHKEIFVRISPDIIQTPFYDDKGSNPDVNPSEEPMSIALIVAIPMLSTCGLAILLIVTTWLRRQALASSGNKATGASESGTMSGVQGEWPTLNTAGLKRTHHPASFMYQHAPPIFDSQSSSNMAKVVNSNSNNSNSGNGSLGKVVPAINDDETWIEVSNKSNQTPSHWVYDDMITKEQAGGSTYCFPDALYASTASTQQHPYIEYASPRDSGFASRTSVISGSPLQRKLMGSGANGSASLESSPVFRHAAHFMTPQPHHRIMAAQGGINRSPLLMPTPPRYVNLRDIQIRHSPEFLSIVKGNFDQFGTDRSAVSSELYARPPSDHFYFKIKDGKTEFI